MTTPRRAPMFVLATRNPDKLREMRALLSGLPLGEFVSAAELGAPEVIEDGTTLEANARKKARELFAFVGQRQAVAGSGILALADDTGLEVDALSGAPGVYSARYAGEDASYADNWQKLLRELGELPRERRQARFRTVMALFGRLADGRAVDLVAEGALSGWIAAEPRGSHGFGYDPVFEFEDDAAPAALRGHTLAELTPIEKNEISHRARAAMALRRRIEELLVGA